MVAKGGKQCCRCKLMLTQIVSVVGPAVVAGTAPDDAVGASDVEGKCLLHW